MIEFNPESNLQLSLLLFGGTIKEDAIEPSCDAQGAPIIFKTGARAGQIKTRRVEVHRVIKGLGLRPLKEWETKRAGIYSTDDEVLTLLAKKKGSDGGRIAELMLTIRNINKQLSTYFDNVEKLIYPDGCIHPSFTHVQTDTSRLSSRNPNVQNVPKSFESNVKQHFTSRYPGGKIIECDFSQLEIVVQAQLCQDKKYIQDILNKVDFHVKRLATQENLPYEKVLHKVKVEKDPIWIEKRSKIKQFSFARAYGAGPNKIADQTGMSVEEVKDLIKNEDIEYPQLKRYNDMLEEFVKYTAKGGDLGYYCSPTSRRYYFKSEPAPEWMQKKGIYTSFRPTQIKNYMVQGTATGDIVLIMLGKFFREAIKHRDKFLLINTVHDSIILDCREEYVDFACQLLQEVLSSTKDAMKKEFNIDWVVPIEFETKVGESWYECGL